MTKEQREKLLYEAGILLGISWSTEFQTLADAILNVHDDIKALLEEDAS